MVNSTGTSVLCFSDSELAKEPVAMLALEDEFIGDGGYIKLVHLVLVDGQDHVWFKLVHLLLVDGQDHGVVQACPPPPCRWTGSWCGSSLSTFSL